MFDAIFNLLPDYSGVTLYNFGLYILAGIFGALVRVSWLNKPLRGFYKDNRSGGWRMGFYAEVVTAIAVAIIVSGHPIRAGIAAIFAPSILDSIKLAFTNYLPKVTRAVAQVALDGTDPPNNER